MKLVSAIIENFLGIGSAEVKISDKGLVLIQGKNEDDPSADSNGSGKSSLIDALFWAMYGETARGSSGDSVINREAGKDCRVVLKLEDGSSNAIIVRWRKYKGFHKPSGVSFVADGVDLTGGTDALTQENIDRFVGASKDVFVAAVYAGQEAMPDLPSMADRQLKSLIEEAAGIDLIEQAYEIAREKASAAKTSVEHINKGKEVAERDVTKAEEGRDRAITDRDAWGSAQDLRIKTQEGTVRYLVGEAKRIKEQIAAAPVAAIEDGIKIIEATIGNLKNLVAECDRQIAATASEQAELRRLDQEVAEAEKADTADIRKLELAIQAALDEERMALTGPERSVTDSNLAFAKVRNELARLRVQLEREQLQLGRVHNKVGEPCGECGKEITECDLKSVTAAQEATVQAAVEAEKKARVEYNAAKVTLEKAIEVRDQTKADTTKSDAAREALKNYHPVSTLPAKMARDAYAKSMTDTSAVMKRKAAGQRGIAQAESDLRERTAERANAAALTGQLENAKERAKRENARLDELKAEKNPYSTHVDRALELLGETHLHLADISSLYEKASKGQLLAAQTAEVFGPKGVRARILDTVTPFLNDRTAYYLSALSDGNLTATWSTLTVKKDGSMAERFAIDVSKYGGGDFASLSGGEKRKVRLSTALALQDLVASRASKPIEIFIGDEIDHALDSAGLERLMGVLEAKAREKGTVLIVSHNDMADWCRDIATVTMKDKKATVEGVLCH